LRGQVEDLPGVFIAPHEQRHELIKHGVPFLLKVLALANEQCKSGIVCGQSDRKLSHDDVGSVLASSNFQNLGYSPAYSFQLGNQSLDFSVSFRGCRGS